MRDNGNSPWGSEACDGLGAGRRPGQCPKVEACPLSSFDSSGVGMEGADDVAQRGDASPVSACKNRVLQIKSVLAAGYGGAGQSSDYHGGFHVCRGCGRFLLQRCFRWRFAVAWVMHDGLRSCAVAEQGEATVSRGWCTGSGVRRSKVCSRWDYSNDNDAAVKGASREVGVVFS